MVTLAELIERGRGEVARIEVMMMGSEPGMIELLKADRALALRELAAGIVLGDRPFQTSLCDDLEQASATCAALERTLSAALRAGGGDLVQLDEANGADAFSTAAPYLWCPLPKIAHAGQDERRS